MGSLDGKNYFMIEDKSEADTDLPHDLIVRLEGVQARFLKLTVIEVPYGQTACVSGLRIFGVGDGEKPEAPEFEAYRENELDMMVKIEGTNATGYNILWGSQPDKLYHSHMVFGNEQRIGALVKGKEYYVRVDAFNEMGLLREECKDIERLKMKNITTRQFSVLADCGKIYQFTLDIYERD